MTRIAVYGAGGVGGYFGARLARAGADVHFIARGAHLRALREHGLRVRSLKGDFQVQWPKRMAAPCRRPPRTAPWPWRRP
jgi:2-dehydropantoate 2-reductase